MPTLRYGDVVDSSDPEEVTDSIESKIMKRRASEDSQSSTPVSDEQSDDETQPA